MAIIVIIVVIGAVYGVSHGKREYRVKVDRHGRTSWKRVK
jgi:hypothetical protein